MADDYSDGASGLVVQRGVAPLHVPAVLVGLGEFGSKVAERLLAERRAVVELGRLGTHEAALEGPDPRRQADHVLDELGLVALRSAFNSAAIAEQVLVAVRRALAHRRLASARDIGEIEHHTRLTILVFADLGEAEVRERLWPVLEAIQTRLLTELGPIFEPYRTGRARNGVVLPILTMPHPPTTPEGPAIVASVRALLDAVASTPPRRRSIPQVYLLEDVAEFSVLSPAELEQCVRNFATLLIYADPIGETGELVARLIHGAQPDEPLATFVCAVAELPRTKLAAYGRDRVSLELLDAILQAPRVEHTLAEADLLEEVEGRSYRPDDEAEKDVRAVLERYAPQITADPHPAWWQRGQLVRDAYGPDPGDPSLLDPEPPASPPRGWLEGRMREIEATWRLLQRKRFDDVVARDRQAIEQWRDGLLARLRKRIDRELWQDPSPQSLRRTQELARRLRRVFGEQLDEAVRQRDRARPAPAPDFQQLRDAHASVLDAARRKPDPDRMLGWALLSLFALVVFLPAVLTMVADSLNVSPERWFEPLLRRLGWATSLMLGLLAIGGWCGLALARAHLALTRSLDEMWRSLESTIDGERGSLLEYFSTRIRLSRAIARVEALLAVQAALEADDATLMLIDKAARRARAELRDNLRVLGVELADDPIDDDIGGLLGRNGEVLVEPFVSSEPKRSESGARSIVEALPPENRESRVHDMLTSLARHYGRDDRWREELPFADLPRIRAAAAVYAQPIASWDPFAGAERAQATAERLAAFVRRQRRSLRGALDFSGYETSDPTGIDRPLRGDGEAIVPRVALELIRDRASRSADHFALRPGNESDRAYYVVAASGIDPRAVASLRPKDTPPSAASTPQRDDPPAI